MLKLTLNALPAHHPEQTYQIERLQSARWLGWDLPAPAVFAPSTPKARSMAARLAEALGLATVRADGKPT